VISIAILLLVALIGFAVVAKLLHGSMEHPANLNQLLEHLEPVNAACFRHLASDADAAFLRRRLPAREYRRIRKLRLKALHAYYGSALRNAAVLLSYGELLVRSEKAELVAFGQQLSPAAMQLRLVLMRGMVGILVCYLVPLDVPLWRQISDRYEQIGTHIDTFCAIHAPDLRLTVSEHFPI
jgi:hypothetical protein